MESQQHLDDSTCESESNFGVSTVPNSEICGIENDEECDLYASSDSASKDFSAREYTEKVIPSCSVNSLADEHSHNGLVSSVDNSLTCSEETSDTEGNEPTEHELSELTKSSNQLPTMLQDIVSLPNSEDESVEHLNSCNEPVSLSENDTSNNESNSVVSLSKNSSYKSSYNFSKVLSEDNANLPDKNSALNLTEHAPVDLSFCDAADSFSKPVETGCVKSYCEVNNDSCKYESIEHVSQTSNKAQQKIELSTTENNPTNDKTLTISTDVSEVAVVKSDSNNPKSNSKIDQSVAESKVVDMTVSTELYSISNKSSPSEAQLQDPFLELQSKKTANLEHSDNDRDLESTSLNSEKLDKKVSDGIPSSPKQNSSNTLNDISREGTAEYLLEKEVLTSLEEGIDSTVCDLKQVASMENISSKNLSNLESSISLVDGAPKTDTEDNQTAEININCGAVDLTKAQFNNSTLKQCLDIAPSSFENTKKDLVPNSCSDLHPLSNKETGLPDFIQELVTVGRYVSVKGDFTLRSSEALIESPSLIAPFLLKEPDIFPLREQPLKSDNKEYFQTSVGEFLVGLGLSRCNEWYFRDMVHLKTRQIRKEGKTHESEEELKTLQSKYFQAKMANEPYVFPNKTCLSCNYNTESDIVLEGHMLVPHLISHREYECGFCSYINRDPKSILNHMKTEHDKTGRMDAPLYLYECPNCMFECNTRVKFTTHMNRCTKYYNPATVQLPPKDFEFPCLTPKPITVAVVKAYEKSLSSMQARYRKSKKGENAFDSYHPPFNQHPDNSRFHLSYESNYNMGVPDGVTVGTPGFFRKSTRPPHPSFMGSNLSHIPYPQGNKYYQAASNGSALYSTLSNNTAVSSPLSFPFLPNPAQKNIPNQSFKGMFPPYLPQPPKLQGPYPVPTDKSTSCVSLPLQSNNLVVCEICDGYIKDMEQLRTHMQLIHKVKIHPKVLSSRPPLNCQKCQWRFFTDQGLERHLLGAHGLVTSNMQDMANKNKDSGCCTICGRVFASKLVVHMSQIHKVTLKPAHLSYKCTVCSATFNLYRLFENHVYLVHSSNSSKRSAENSDLLPSKKTVRTSNWESSIMREKNPRYLVEKENGAA